MSNPRFLEHVFGGIALKWLWTGAIASASATLLLSGCAVGPDFKTPEPPTATRYTKQALPGTTGAVDKLGGGTQRFVEGQDIPAEWWSLFHSQSLNALIEQALQANPDLQSAKAALRVATENLRAQHGAYFPAVTANAAASRNKASSVISPPLNSSVLLYNLYQTQLDVSWTLDIFGANRRRTEVLKAQENAQRFELEAVYVALTTNVVAAAIQEAALRTQITATSEIIGDERRILGIMKQQYALGQIPGSDVAAQEAALALAEQALPPLHKQLSQQRNLLTALAGRLSSDEITQTFDLSLLRLPEDLPVSLPSKLVEQRPDIRIAEENLHAASAQIGVAIANMLPDITLSASDGTVATKFGQLFLPGNGFWSVGVSAAQPLFDGGALLHQTRAARAAYDQAAANYRSVVVTAFQNVADTLHALQSDTDMFRAAVATETASAKSLDIARKELKLGQVSGLAVLNAEQTYEQAIIARVQAQANQYADTAVLFQALGGGWWNQTTLASGD